MGNETIRDGKWFPEAILNDLVEMGGLSAKSVGYDIKDLSARRFFYDKVPFALVGWKADSFAIVAFAPEMDKLVVEGIVDAFIKVFGYNPFVSYTIFENNEDFVVYHWDKNSASARMREIFALPKIKNIKDLADIYTIRDLKND